MSGSWKWVIVFSSFMLEAIEFGIVSSFGVLLINIIDVYDSNEEVASWIGSIQTFFLHFTGIIGGPLLKIFGARNVVIAGSVLSAAGCLASAFAPNVYILYFTYGTLTGVGTGFIYVTILVVIQLWFNEDQRSLASGIAVSGVGLGMAVFNFLIEYLVKHIQFHWALRVMSLIYLSGVLCGMLFKPLPDDQNNLNQQQYMERERKTSSRPDHENKSQTGINKKCEKLSTEVADYSLFKRPTFALYCFSSSMCAFGYYVPFTYIPLLAESIDIPKENSVFLLSIAGIVNVISRFISGCIGNIGASTRFYLLEMSFLGLGALNVFISIYNIYPTLLMYSVCFAVLSGCYSTLFAVVLVDLFGIENVEKSVGQCLAVNSFFFLLGVPMSGFIVDRTGSTVLPFTVIGIALLLASVAFMCIKCFHSPSEYESFRN